MARIIERERERGGVSVVFPRSSPFFRSLRSDEATGTEEIAEWWAGSSFAITGSEKEEKVRKGRIALGTIRDRRAFDLPSSLRIEL